MGARDFWVSLCCFSFLEGVSTSEVGGGPHLILQSNLVVLGGFLFVCANFYNCVTRITENCVTHITEILVNQWVCFGIYNSNSSKTQT